MRLAIYQKKKAFVEMYNSQKGDDAEVALNHMADWTEEEYTKILGYQGHKKVEERRKLFGFIHHHSKKRHNRRSKRSHRTHPQSMHRHQKGSLARKSAYKHRKGSRNL